MYDWLVVGAGLYGAVAAQQLNEAGRKCLVIDKRPHIAGNLYTEQVEGIQVHRYGAHILHTNNPEVWAYVNRFAKFNHYIHSPIANYKGTLYNLPFNMNTFYAMWGCTSPEQAKVKIEQQRRDHYTAMPGNLEEQAINLVGMDIYEKMIRGYTEKQWGRPCSELPCFIIKRLPVRFTFDNNYFNAAYQGIPECGYTKMIENMLDGVEVQLEVDYLQNESMLSDIAKRIIFTGPIDAYFNYCYGSLQYRSLRFETETMDYPNYQGNAVVNYTDRDTPYTRIIEHKHFAYGTQPKTIISKEYSVEWEIGLEPYYPINDDQNNRTYECYNALAKKDSKAIFGGRLGDYKYYDMDTTIIKAIETVKRIE